MGNGGSIPRSKAAGA